MLKHTFSPPSFRKKQYFKINLTTTDSTQNHQETWENSNISKLYNLLPVFVERKHSLHLETFKRINKVHRANPLFCRNFQHLPQANTFKGFINNLNGAIVFVYRMHQQEFSETHIYSKMAFEKFLELRKNFSNF